MSEEIRAEFERYRFVAVCKTCGVVDETVLTREEATEPNPVENNPAFEHHERTGHLTGSINYTVAPPDIQEMLDGGAPRDIDWPRLVEALDGGGGA